jgi:hypothetical protein
VQDANTVADGQLGSRALPAGTATGHIPGFFGAMNTVSDAGSTVARRRDDMAAFDAAKYRIFQKTSADFDSYRAIMRGVRNVL